MVLSYARRRSRPQFSQRFRFARPRNECLAGAGALERGRMHAAARQRWPGAPGLQQRVWAHGAADHVQDRRRVGRLGHVGPVLFDEDLRTGIAHAEYQVAVEADQVDLEAREGWVVLVRGAAHHLDAEAERAPIIGAGLEPWIAGVPAHFIRVNPTSTWGNRIIRA